LKDKKDVKFCLKCNRMLDKRWNSRYDGTLENFCNMKCETAHKRKREKKPTGAPKKDKQRDFFDGR